MEAGQGLGVPGEGLEEGQGMGIAAVQEKLLGLIADPTVGGAELGDQFGCGERSEAGDGAGALVGGKDAVDPTAFLAGSVVGEQFLATFLGEPFGVLNHVPVHVHHPQGAVGSGPGQDGTEPAVVRAEEFGMGLLGVAAGLVGDIGGGEEGVVNEVVEGFAGEAVEGGAVGKEEVITVDMDGAGGGEVTGFGKGMKAFLLGAGGIDARVGWGDESMKGKGSGDVGVSAEVLFLEDIVPDGPGVLFAKPVAEVFAVASELGGSGLGFEFAGLGAKAEVAAAQVEGGVAGVQLNAGIAAVAGVVGTAGAMDPVVEAPAQAIDPELLVALEKAAEEGFLVIGPAVAVAVLEEQNSGGSGDQDAISPTHDAGGKGEVLGKNGAVIVPAIGVGVLQETDASARTAIRFQAEGVIDHFHHPKSALGIPVEGDGGLDEGFGSDQFRGETGSELQALKGLIGRGGGWFEGGS